MRHEEQTDAMISYKRPYSSSYLNWKFWHVKAQDVKSQWILLWWVDLGWMPDTHTARQSVASPPQQESGRKYNRQAHGLIKAV